MPQYGDTAFQAAASAGHAAVLRTFLKAGAKDAPSQVRGISGGGRGLASELER